ncbi:hypothetical protein [Actinokineospora globicatena]|uniref:Uncharacterized protein n=1 Tax=Actinokineospora globicatena TaxID=103729 RepID=A0A9W6QKV1_9PSEU|nr:hypothetical protein [Actinokineospora globicatena]GLW90427.1 hypothetical protein Aglo03_12430 [Actinokineospora globicatena]
MRPIVVLLTTESGKRDLCARLREVGEYTEAEHFDILTVGECQYGVNVTDSVKSDFDDDELAEVDARVGAFASVMLEYRGTACVRSLLETVLPGLTGVLDTDHGQLLDFAEVLARFSREPDWDWRRPH